MRPPYPKILIIDQDPVDFLFDELMIYSGEDGYTYVSFNAVCAKFAFDLEDELRGLAQYPILHMGMHYHLRLNEEDKEEITLMFRMGHFALWLAILAPERIQDEPIRLRLIGFQNEVAQLLEEAVHEGRLTHAPTITYLLSENLEIAQGYRSTIQLMVKLRSRLLKRLPKTNQ